MKRGGFTLLELLFVIFLITIFIGLLAPALQTAKNHAKVVSCGFNIKKLTMAMIAYDQYHEGFPYGFDDLTRGSENPPGGYVGDASRDMMGWWWFQSALEGCDPRCGSSRHPVPGCRGQQRSGYRWDAPLSRVI